MAVVREGLDSERRVGVGAVEGRVAGVAILLGEPMQLAEVMPLDGLGEVGKEPDEFSGRLGGQLERDTDDWQIIRFYGDGPQVFFVFFAARDLALRAVRSCASL